MVMTGGWLRNPAPVDGQNPIMHGVKNHPFGGAGFPTNPQDLDLWWLNGIYRDLPGNWRVCEILKQKPWPLRAIYIYIYLYFVDFERTSCSSGYFHGKVLVCQRLIQAKGILAAFDQVEVQATRNRNLSSPWDDRYKSLKCSAVAWTPPLFRYRRDVTGGGLMVVSCR